jgi:hypothetical protein
MRFSDFKKTRLFEMATGAVDNLKSMLADKIKTLPADDASIKTLREIEDLLRDVNAGGFKGLLKKDLQSIQDPAVTAAQKEIAMYIMNIEGTVEERQELFNMWREDTIVNKDALFSGDDMSFDEIFNRYGTNTFITELVDTLMRVSSNGHGKGEFALSVFSKDINKPPGNKGDLVAHYNGKLLHVEVKTSDMGATTVDPDTGEEKPGKPSSARFGDQEVTVSDEWYAHAKDLNNFVQGREEYAKRKGIKLKVPDSGMNLTNAINIYQGLDPSLQPVFLKKLTTTVRSIFSKTGEIKRAEYIKRLNRNVDAIVGSIEAGSVNGAKQAYAQATFNYYMSMKKDDGVLYIDLANEYLIWYNNADELTNKGLRLDAATIFLTGISDPKRTAFPQIFIKPTTVGGNTAISGIKKLAKGKNPINNPDFASNLSQWIMQLANDRNVRNSKLLQQITMATYSLIASGTPSNQILASLEQQFPQLQVAVARTVARKQAAATTAPATTVPATTQAATNTPAATTPQV